MSYGKLCDGLKSEFVEKIELIRGLYLNPEMRADVDAALGALRENKNVPFFKMLDYFNELRSNILPYDKGIPADDLPNEMYRIIIAAKNSCDNATAESIDVVVRGIRAKTLGVEGKLSSLTPFTVASRSENGYGLASRTAINRQHASKNGRVKSKALPGP